MTTDPTPSELKPCPFCGESVFLHISGCGDCDPCIADQKEQCAIGATTYTIGCILCAAKPSVELETAADAIVHWNTRADLDRVLADCAAKDEALRGIAPYAGELINDMAANVQEGGSWDAEEHAKWAAVSAALSTSSPNPILERLKKAEEERDDARLAFSLLMAGWTLETASLYDEEGVEGWRWISKDGQEEATVTGDWSEFPTIPDILRLK